jgi:hypothetical protein
MYARNHPKPVKVVLRLKEKVAMSPDELVKWIKDLNPGLYTEHWSVLERQLELKGLLTDQDSLKTIKGARYKIFTFTGLTQGTVKVLRDPEQGATASPAPSGSLWGGGWTDASTPSGAKTAEWRRATETVGELPPSVKPAPVDPGPPSDGAWSAEKGEGKVEWMETNPPPNETSKKA